MVRFVSYFLILIAGVTFSSGCLGDIEMPFSPRPSNDFTPAPETELPAGPVDNPTPLEGCDPTQADVGRPTLRHLNRFEYNRTVADLLGDTSEPARDFPADDFGLGFDNLGDVLSTAPLLVEKYAAAAETLAAVAIDADIGAANPRIVICDPASGTACLRRIFSAFGRRAFRRPLGADEVDKLVALIELAKKEGDSVQTGLKLATQAVLLSPYFLYHVETDDDPRSPEAHRLNDYALASRLSYFLWGSMPDARLSTLADNGTLHANLEAQTRRMLEDSRAQALVTQFAGSWLGSRAIESSAPDAVLFPTSDALKKSMREESELFFTAILRENRNAQELFGADFTYLNDDLAAHYGLPRPDSTAMSRVALVPGLRGQLLGQAGLLMVTSHADRTSPVKRGKWVLSQLMCDSPPPPPPGVEALKPAENPNASLRQQMEAHRANPACARCHSAMDPIGFALEGLDPVGRTRVKDDLNFDVDDSGTLPDGRTFHGPVELAGILKNDQRFAACITRQLYVYGTTRATMPADACALASLSDTFKQGGYKLSDLIVHLVKSPAFTHRRGEPQ
ncbi:MAG: DUF1592 domain-containing protein [Myxococcaceae bacterium]|nr:DUF1592 domain-containing protein [Myxococcaceae bacterium]